MIEAFESPKTCKVKENWSNAGRIGLLYGILTLDRKLGIVTWDDDELEPTFQKLNSLQVKSEVWKNI